jgi:phytol kinase
MTYLGESIDSLWYPLIIIFLYLTVLVTIAEGLNRLIADDPEITRKVVHIGSGNVILLAWWLKISTWVIITAAIIASIIALVSYYTPILPSINSVGRKSLGTLFYAISIGVLTAAFWQDYPQYTAIGILTMAWGDGMAAIIGQRYGKHPYQVLGITKSWEGSLTMAGFAFLVTSLILFFVQGNCWQTWLIALITSIVASSMETLSKWGIDNLTVPLTSAMLCFWCNQLLNIS